MIPIYLSNVEFPYVLYFTDRFENFIIQYYQVLRYGIRAPYFYFTLRRRHRQTLHWTFDLLNTNVS